ncbi:MAG: adenylyl-sulfate kinase [Polyangiaceae bacterium]|nr:adenylyl-sulfate kinase [Polyangiaceae bacterium]
MTGAVVWITGLPSSGKSTLAGRLAVALRERGWACCVLDGDAVRDALVPPPGYDEGGRRAFYETLARLAALVAAQGTIAVVPATANRAEHRARARALAPRFVEVHVGTPLEVCRARDPKGLYARAGRGELAALPGATEPFEAPRSPDVRAEGGEDERAVAEIVARLGPAPRGG